MTEKKMIKINNLQSLQAERKRLEALEKTQKDMVNTDMEFIKKEFLSGPEVLNKAAESIVPFQVRRSNLINAPINFLAEKIFNINHDVVTQESDKGKGNRARNIALGVLESVGSYLLIKYIRSKI
jgi:hypothetical protein